MAERRIDYMALAGIQAAARNPKRHDKPGIRRSIGHFGFVEVPVVDERTGRLVAGHGRINDLTERKQVGGDPPDGVTIADDGDWLVPVIRGWTSRSDNDAEAYLAASNKLGEVGGWDDVELGEMLRELAAADLLDLTGFTADEVADLILDDDGDGSGEAVPAGDHPSLVERFLVPPFDVLDTRTGYWRERKRRWLDIGIESEIGRGEKLAYSSVSARDPDFYDKKREAEARLGRELTLEEFTTAHYVPLEASWAQGTSLFDPVLCELTYRWFSPPDGRVLDPFAGGSVRGVVAGILGREYHGNDLSAVQVAANEEQGRDMHARGLITAPPAWTAGDSTQWVATLPAESFDLLFTCPPYYDLEVYSDDPADLSNLTYEQFDAKYAEILAGAVRALRRDRFAVIVTGDARDGRGRLHDLRAATVRAAEAAGLYLASAAVLLTPVGSVAARAASSFLRTRVLGRVHQDVLIFCKGDRKRATQACGDVEVHLPDDPDETDPE